ncbi:MAG: adenylyl-sulfate kinase [Gemmatimonadota bacterium]|nr:adenylyl-sulfate kinase [Gemmatimonadota bacterium]
MTGPYRESHARAIGKAISWRVLGTLATTFLVWLFTRQVALAATVGALEAIMKGVLYYAHERGWNHVRFGRHEAEPAVVWFTGLSGSGKSTIAEEVFAQLKRRGYKAERLDGDTIRSIFPQTGFTRDERDAHIRRVGYLASKLEQNGVFVVASLVSPYQDSRDFVRSLCRNFIEVYISTSLDECERRDVKGLYARARRGEIKNFTGIDDPYESPTDAEVVIDTTQVSVDAAAVKILSHMPLRS